MREQGILCGWICALVVVCALFSMKGVVTTALLAQEPAPSPSPADRTWEALQTHRWYVQSVALEGLAEPLTLTNSATVQVSELGTMALQVRGCKERLFYAGAIPGGNTYGISDYPYYPADQCSLRYLRDLLGIALSNTDALEMDGDDLLLRGEEPFVEVRLVAEAP